MRIALDEVAMTDNKALGRLLAAKRFLSRQQYKTIKGQILSGNAEGAMRGLDKIVEKADRCFGGTGR